MSYCDFIRELGCFTLFQRAPKPSSSHSIPLGQVTISGKPQFRVWSACTSTLQKVLDYTLPGGLLPLKSALETFLVIIDSMEDKTKDQEVYKELASELKTTVELLTPQLNNPNYDHLSTSIEQMAKSIADDVEQILKEQKKVSGGRFHYKSRRRYNEIRTRWKKANGTLKRLHVQLHHETANILKKGVMDKNLALLGPVQSALYGCEPEGIIRQHCAEGTRKEILKKLDSWLDGSHSRLFWINGMAGTGKTTIAYTYANSLSEKKKPVVSFFCSRLDPGCRNLHRIIPTIVYQLTRLSKTFQNHLYELLEKDSNRACLTNITEQFKTLLGAPFEGVNLSEDITVIIDALDECEQLEPGAINVFLEHLIQYTGKLPLRFLVTSRPEPQIRGMMELKYGTELDKSMISLHEMDVREDIWRYLDQKFAPMSLSNEELASLVEQCGPLFIYAITLVRYIKPWESTQISNSSRPRLNKVLQLEVPTSAKIYTELDLLYSMVLNSAFDDDLDNEEKDNVRLVLGTVLCAKEPISIKTIAVLCGIADKDKGTAALKKLPSVIHISEKTGLVSVFHASFLDFMFDPKRAGELLYCRRAEHNDLMAQQCFGLMWKGLRFNICKLDSSYLTDKEAIAKLQIDVDKIIESPLWYACRYWAEHLEQTTGSEPLCSKLKSFLSQLLLFWMEVLNLKEGIAVGGDALLRTGLWLTEHSLDADLIAFVQDAKNFLASFAASPASISTPHIYTSFLPFCPRSSAIFKYYRDCFRDLVEPDERTMRVREVAALASWKSKAKVLSVAYSHDGLSIAFGCRDGTVGVHMSYNNTRTFGNEQNPGHDKPVWSVAFSPNKDKASGRIYLASGSDDGTIQTWNLDGTVRSICRLKPLPDTTNPGEIKSIAFSPKCDGTIASGSSDRTVCIWDSSNGTLLVGPLYGHEEEIWSVAFSPDGDLVASGSDDQTIRLWNSKDGQPVLTLTDQGGEINSISFSPDGTRMASGSSNKTVCVWDPKDGKVIAGPFAAHSYKVSCVKFSSDGKYLASSSHDRTIRVWDPLDGKPIAGPFEGHTGPVYSIAFSPDDTRIVSGSPDGTIRLWDPRREALGDGVLKNHTEAVSSVAFSPDGQHIASCSYDGTMRMWDLRNNLPIAGGTPIGSHDRKMTSLAFSSDGAWVVTGSLDHKARVWDIRRPGAAPVIFEEHSGPIWSIAFSHDCNDSFVASGGGKGDNSIRLWNPSEGTSISPPLTGHTDDVLSIAISPDNLHLASASRDKTLRVWDLKNKAELRVLDRHTRAVWSVAYSHDGSKIASSSSDGTILVWNSQKTEVITTLIHDNVPDKWVSSVAFSPDDDFIASSANHTVRLWRLSTGDLVGGPYEGHCELVWSVAFSPNGTHIVSGSHDGTIRFWDIKDAATTTGGQSAGTNAIADEWKLDLDGWIRQGSDLLLWVPHEVARSLLTPHCSSAITSSGPLRVDLNSNLKLGTLWKDCYIPQSNKHTNV